jgi:phenylalanyl-tRNA synthetase beta chain
LSSAAYNFNRDASGVRFFETGHVFRKSNRGTYYDGIGEEVRLLLGLAGLKTTEHWLTEPQQYSIFDLKAAMSGLLGSLNLSNYVSTKVDENNHLIYYIDERMIGELYRVEPAICGAFEIKGPVFAAEFSISCIYELKKNFPESAYKPVSKFPAFAFDFAIVIDASIQAESLLKQIKQSAGEGLETIRVFDVFEGASLGNNKKSIAFRLSFIDENKTLTINDVEPIIEKVLNVLDNKYSAKLRS